MMNNFKIIIENFDKYFTIFKEILMLKNKLSISKSIFYSFKFGERIFIGKNSVLSLGNNSRIIIKNNGCLKVGVEYALPTGTILYMHDNSKLIVNGYASFMKDSSISIVAYAVLEIGHGSFINEQARVKVQRRLFIGEGTIIAWRCSIMDSDVHKHAEEGVNIIKFLIMILLAKSLLVIRFG
jgi:acetyltransferase-like isoleucine patch superfamily enzyme